MLGDIHELADNLWMIEGEMPEDNEKYPDVANSVLYRVKDRLYLIDTGCGIKIRKSIEKVLNEVGPIRAFTLLNSHAHPDHVANNDLIEIVEAEEKHHYISEAGLPMLDFKRYFSDLFYEMSEYFDFLAGFKAHKFYYWFIRRIRGFLKIFMGEKKALRKLIPFALKKWEPVNQSQDTIEFYEKLSK